ncbi:MAG: hypothetical protein P4L82_11000 [Ancalomicrobiaceae bacterium]|nr:hypothetical protein [Ancalomicrobiaceae bacterium]
MLRLKEFVAEGIGPEVLARLVREAAVVRPARGLYQLPDAQVETSHTLAEAAVLVPKGVVCLTTALQFHDLTLQMPSAVWMAIDRAAWRPKIDYPPIRFVRFTGSALTEGVERHRIENVDVPITDPARTIVDCFRYPGSRTSIARSVCSVSSPTFGALRSGSSNPKVRETHPCSSTTTIGRRTRPKKKTAGITLP